MMRLKRCYQAEDRVPSQVTIACKYVTTLEPDEISSSPTPKSSFVLIPLRRNPQQGPKDIPSSPRRPKTAIDDDEFLAKFRQETWDIPGEESTSTTSTARGRTNDSNEISHVRIRQSTGSLSARLHPLQLRKQENGDREHSNSVSNSPSAGSHTSRGNVHRKTLHNPNSTWTEQLEESKETLDACFTDSGKLSSKGSESAKVTLSPSNDLSAHSHQRYKHSQLHLAGTSSLKSHTTSISISSSSTSQPSTPTQSRRKLPIPGSSNGLQRPTFASSTSDRSLSPALGISSSVVPGSSEIPSFLSSSNGRQNSLRAATSSSSRMTKVGDPTTISPNKVHR